MQKYASNNTIELLTFSEPHSHGSEQLYALNISNVIEILDSRKFEDFDHEGNFIKSREKIIPVIDFSHSMNSQKTDKNFFIVIKNNDSFFVLAVNKISNILHSKYEEIKPVNEIINSDIISSFTLYNNKIVNILNTEKLLNNKL